MKDKKLDDNTLSYIYRELGTIKWWSDKPSWNLAIDKVREELYTNTSEQQKIEEHNYING